ncbi:MAG TPA: glycerophosphodiester phosphodiesterase family protein [Pyrinomonadaceae bacterium]|nr:glycerophosphodiester phosphodiesterase family protein [Pyrinomonadaceae bacterium]
MSPKPLIIGHRGASAIAPENTLAAFHRALDSRADGIEFDVRLTRDAVPVVIHDDNLKRTGSRPDKVAELSYEEIHEVDVGSWFNQTHPSNNSDFSGERIPSLEEVLKLFESNHAILYLEMKSDPLQREQLAQACCDHLNRSPVKNRVVVECFDLLSIAAVKAIDPSIRTAALFEPHLLTTPLLTSGRRLVEQALTVEAEEIALHHRLASKGVVATAKTAGLKVVVWTVDRSDWIHRATSMGVSALITNDPGMMVQQRQSFLSTQNSF